MTNDLDDLIRRRAHEIWESEGRPHGRHDEHWQRAREEIEAEAGLSAGAAAQMGSLRGSISNPAQPAPTYRPKRGRAMSEVPKAKEPGAASARSATKSRSSSTPTETETKLLDNMPSELGGARGKERDAPSTTKYRHPENPDLTWSGRGRRPDWIREALEAGRTLSDFEIGA